jgi:hypothetical protein
MNEHSDPSQSLPGFDHLCHTFNEAGLPVPPIPVPLRSSLNEKDRWLWTTLARHQPDRKLDYFCDATWLEKPVPDHVTVSHGGHGINSYALTVRMAWGPLAVIVQDHWGGAYGTPRDEGRLAELFANLRDLLRTVDETMVARWTPFHRPVLIESSQMRGRFRCRTWDRQNRTWITYELTESMPWTAIAGLVADAQSRPLRTKD